MATINPSAVSISITAPNPRQVFNVAPKTYYSYKFNGVNTNYIQVPRSTSIEPSAAITYEWRMRLDALTAAQPTGSPRVIYKRTTLDVFTLPNDGGQLRSVFSTNGTGGVLQIADISTWTTSEIHHVAITYDGTNIIQYIDGVAVNTSPATGTISTDNTTDLFFSGYETGGPVSFAFKGMIDEVRIWSTARTQPQISANMLGEVDPGTSGLVGYWKLNEDSGTIAFSANTPTNDGDINGTVVRTSISYQPEAEIIAISAQSPSVANSLVLPDPVVINFSAQNPTIILGTVTIQPSPATISITAPNPRQVFNVAPKTYYSYKFNGTTSNYIQVPRSTSIEPTAAITIEYRIRLDAVPSAQPAGSPRTMYKRGTLDQFTLPNNGGELRSTFVTSVTGGVLQIYNISAWTISEIHHIAITYNGANIILYIDGAVGVTTPATGTIIINSSTDLFFAIWENGGPVNFGFKGVIDEVRLWSIARTQTQIQDFMLGEINPGTSGLQGYWKLNEQSGTVAYNATTLSNNGTINGSVRTSISYQPTTEIINVSAQSPLVTITKIYPTPTVINITANSVKNNLIIYPDSAIGTFTSNGVRNVQTIHPSPAVTNFSTNSIQVNMTITAMPTIINFVVATPTIRLTQHATESVITLSLPPPTLISIINPTPAVIIFSAQDVDINLVIYPTPAVATFSTNEITADFIIYPSPAVATFSANGIGITLSIYPDAATATFSTNGITVDYILYPTPAVANFSANGITVDYVLYPTPAIAIFSVSNPTIMIGKLIHVDPAVSIFTVPIPNTMIINIKINYTIKIFNEINHQVVIERS